MSDHKSTAESEASNNTTFQEAPAAGTAPRAAESLSDAAVQAPEKRGAAYTIDNRLGYRKEDSEDGTARQIRFADRVGGRPDNELLDVVRAEKPMVRYSKEEKAWGEQKTPDTLEALDRADMNLRDISRRRAAKGSGGQER